MTKKQLIKQCKEQLTWTYIHQLTSLYESDGELYLTFNDHTPDETGEYVKQERTLVFNIHELYLDLASLIELVVSGNCKNQKRLRIELENLLKSNESKTKKKARK